MLRNIHEVACVLAEAFGDTCACNYNDIDEWLPLKCDFAADGTCPNVVGMACWEQYLKHKDLKTEMEMQNWHGFIRQKLEWILTQSFQREDTR